MKLLNSLFVASLCVALPRASLACAVCFSSSDESRIAFIATTALLSTLPLAMIGGAIYWVVRRARRRELGTLG